MRIVFMGTPDFAVNTLESLIGAGHNIELVVTQPDKTQGRGKKLVFSPVKETAMAHGIPVAQPVKVKDQEFVDRLHDINPDVIVVVAFGQILPESILSLPQYGCINVHASLLPAYRGAAPIQWAVIDGLSKTGVTTMYMDKGLDTGDIIDQKIIDIAPDETGGSLFDKLAVLGGELIVETIEKLADGTAARIKQDDSKANYAKMLNKEMGLLDFNKDANELERLIRGLNPWPSAYTRIDGKLLKIIEAEVVSEEATSKFINIMSLDGGDNGNACASSPDNMAGTVIAVDKKSFTIRCGKGSLRVTNLQIEGKKRMDTSAFLLGYQISAGMKLG